MTALDPSFLEAVRGLRTLSPACDLHGFATPASGPLDLLERLVAAGQLNKDEAGRFWSGRIGFAYVDPFAVVIVPEAVAAWSGEIAAKANALPLYRLGDQLTVALPDPSDTKLVQRLSAIASQPVSPVFAFPADLRDLIKLHYATEDSLAEAIRAMEGMVNFNALADGSGQVRQLAESRQIVEFIDATILLALRNEASDIHIEPHAGDSKIRFRIDGGLRTILGYSRKLHAFVVTRLKIMAAIDISESRLPADGRFSVPLGSRAADFRFSTIPTQYGEKAVLRIIGNPSRRSSLTLDQMMVSQTVLRPLRRIIRAPSGIFLVTGPTGSGKTTILHAALAELNKPDVNICSVEDPIEIRVEGVQQTQIQPQIELTFARMLRAFLRQDPDILLVGEIRDLETAQIAAEAALTGHVVFATLHTNSSPEAIVRLRDMGVDPFLLAPTLLGVLSQRLAPRICENCKEPYTPSEELLRRYFSDETLPEVTFYRGRGCPVCHNTGFKGRVSFHELLLVNRRMRGRISAGADQIELAELGVRTGYRPLRYDGLKKVLLGLTTIEEIEAATPIELD